MKNIMKIIIALFTSVSLISSVSAGELTVTGNAKATYNILSGDINQGKGIGVANEFDLGATGELDNGWSWNYQVQFDPGNSAASAGGSNGQVDDSRLTISTDYGTLGIFVSEGGLDTDNAASQSVYGRPTDIGLASGMVDGPAIDSFNNLQYHTPAGILPYDMTAKVAYATGQNNGMNSSNAKGSGLENQYGNAAQQFQITAAPIDGLKLFADYYEEKGAYVHVIQQYEAGSVAGTYSTGAFSFGLSRTLTAPLIQAADAATNTIANATAAGGNAGSARTYTATKGSVAFNVNDALSVSFEREESERMQYVRAAEYDITAQAVQAAYTMGGMTVALSYGQTDNVGYADGVDVEQTLLAVTMAF